MVKLASQLHSTPSKSTPVKNHFLETLEGQSPICKLVQVVFRKTTKKSSWKFLIFGEEKGISEKESHENLDQFLNIGNLSENGLRDKLVLKTSSNLGSG